MGRRVLRSRPRNGERGGAADSGDEHDDAYDKAVHKPPGVARVAINPRGYEGPDAENAIDPSEPGEHGRRGKTNGRDDDNDRADNPAIPRVGRRIGSINPGRHEKPDTGQQRDRAGYLRRL